MIIPKTEEEKLAIVASVYEVLDSFKVQRYKTGDGIVELFKDGRIFGIMDYEKILYLRIRPLFWCIYPPGSYHHGKIKYKMVYLSDPVDKEYVTKEVQKAWQVAEEMDSKKQ